KTDIRNDEGKFITVAPHCEHGAEVAKRAVDHQSHDPLRLVGLVTQNLRSEEQVGEKKAEEQSEGRGGKSAQGETFEEPIDENENQPENQTDNQAGDGVVLRLSGDKRTNRSAKGEEEHPQKINGQLRSHFGLTTGGAARRRTVLRRRRRYFGCTVAIKEDTVAAKVADESTKVVSH